MAQFNSFDEIENNKSKWTLDSDQKLLNTLQSTSEKQLTKIKKLSDNFQASEDAVCKSTSKIDNLMTSVLLLSNTKFVENRVYDEDINEIQKSNAPAYQPKNVEQSKSQVESAFLGNLKSSIVTVSKRLQNKLGLKHDDILTLDKINLVNNLYCNNDPFSKIPLPYLIGSEDFIKATFVGLKNSPDNSPIRLSEHPNAFDYNNLPSTSPIDNNNVPNHSNYQSDEDEIFSEHPSFASRNLRQPPKPNNSLFDPTINDDEEDDLFTSSIVRSRESSIPKVIPPADVHVDTHFEKEQPQDILSQLAAQIKSRKPTHPSISASSSSSSLSKDNLAAQPARPAVSNTIRPSILSKTVAPQIFDSDGESDDDLFSKSFRPSSKTIDNKSSNSLKSDSVSSFHTSTATTTTTNNSNIDVRSRSSLSSNSTLSTDVNVVKDRYDEDVAIFANKNKSILGNKFLFSSDDEDDNLFGGGTKASTPKTKPVETKQDDKSSHSTTKGEQPKWMKNNISSKKNTSKLFSEDDDDDDDDLFGTKASSVIKKDAKPAIKSSKSLIFSSSVINELNTKFGSKLSVQDGRPEQVTNSVEKEPEVKEVPKVSPQPNSILDNKTNKINKHSSLFDDDDDDEDDLFKSVKSPKIPNKTIVPENAKSSVDTPQETSKINQIELPIETKTDHEKEWKFDNTATTTQNDNTNIHQSDDESASSKQEQNISSANEQRTQQKSMFSSNFLSELNSTLAKKNPLSTVKSDDNNSEQEQEKDDKVQDNPNNQQSVSASIDQDDDHFKILKSKARLSINRNRRRPSRGHFSKLASSQSNDSDNSAFNESVVDNFNQLLPKLSQNSSRSGSFVDEIKESSSTPVVLEIDIDIALPKQSPPIPAPVTEVPAETVPDNVAKNVMEEILETVPNKIEKEILSSKPKMGLRKSVFDSDDSDSDTFNPGKTITPIVKKPVSLEKTVPKQSASKPTISLGFSDSDSNEEEGKLSKAEIQAQRRPAIKASIFDDDSDEDLFRH